MDDVVIDRLADYCTNTSYEHIPEPVLKCAVERVVDSLGCAVGSLGSEPIDIAIAAVEQTDAPSTPSPGRWVSSRSRICDVASAGFVNSTMIRYLDFNDTVPRGGHPSDSLGPILAHADASRIDGRSLITAVVVAYDAFIRCVTVTKLRERGWDQGFGVGIAVAAGVSKLLNLDRDKTRHALSIAAVSNLPMRATRAGQLSTWKGMATAFSARNAYFSTILASEGATGPRSPIQGRHGLMDLVTGPFDFPPLSGEHRFLTSLARLKYWPVESHLQPVVWAAMELRKHGSIEDFEEVDVATSWSAWHETGSELDKWDPQSRETADHSLPYVFARSLEAGYLDISAFDPASYLDAGIRTFMKRVKVRVDDDIEARFHQDTVLRLSARDRTGKTHRIEIVNPKGHNSNPLTEVEVHDKFIRLVKPRLGEAPTIAALNWWNAVIDADDVSVGFDKLSLG